MNVNRNLYLELPGILQENKPCALATIISAQGSTPRKPGVSAIFGPERLLAGTIGGGPAEYRILRESKSAIASRFPAVLNINLGGDIQERSDAICGGNMTVLLDAFPEKHFATFTGIKESLIRHQRGILLSLVEFYGKEVSISRFWIPDKEYHILPKEYQNLLRMDNAGTEEVAVPAEFRMIPVAGGEAGLNFALLETIIPPPSLFIAGAGHIGKALSQLGKMLDFEVTVWDKRVEFANKQNLPDADIILTGNFRENPGKPEIRKDTYIVIVTHGHRDDAEVLREVINSGAAYIGMIGSKAKVNQMKENFLKEGWATPEQWENICSPVGLDIGARTAEEIAVSIAAQLIRVRRSRGNNHA